MTPLLDAKGLAIGGRLHPCDLRLERAELVALVGPNGSGKTSLLHALAGIGEAAGSVRIAGEDPSRAAPERRKRLLAYLPAGRDSVWPVTARDLVRLGLPTAAAEDEVRAAMGALALEPFADRRVDRLSTGERSRVLIARALAPRPLLLLLDEPSANLDPYWQLTLLETLRSAVRGHGQGVIAALHDLGLAERYADRLILMNEGRIAADGEPRDVVAGAALRGAFGIERVGGRWEAVRPAADRRSSP